MRSHFALLSVVLLLSARASAQTEGQLYTASREQLDVTKVVLAQETAWNKGDLDTYLSYFRDAKDTEAVRNGPVHGMENSRSAYHGNFPNREAMGTLEQREVTVRELGPDFALATGRYHLARAKKNGGDAEGTFTEIFQKTEIGWKLVFSEAT